MANNVIKSIFPQTCPHCNKEIIIGVQSVTPIISEIMTEKDVTDAKEQVRNKANEMLSGDDLKSTIEWLDDENTIFGMNDVPSIIENFKK